MIETRQNETKVILPNQETFFLDQGLSFPDVPEGYQREESGLIIPAVANKEGTGQSDTLIVPTGKDVSELAQRDSFDKKDSQNWLFFVSSPWGYFKDRLKKAEVVSPIDQIKDQVESTRSLVEISDDSKSKLRSLDKNIRIKEQQRLVQQGVTKFDIQIITAPDIALIDVSRLEFVSQSAEGDSLDVFYDFLDVCIDELFNLTDNNSSELEHIARVSTYLGMLSHAFLYRFGENKLNNPQLLEKIAIKIEFLADEGLSSPKYLQELFGFISYFEMNNADVSSFLLEVLEVNNYKHPLSYELKYQLGENEEETESLSKIGIEIEGIPLVLFGDIPDGFEMGIDGGETMPEIRREKKDIRFDSKYKKDLFDFWYFTRMVNFKGASLHVHIDDPDKDKLKLFNEFLGDNIDTVRSSGFKTIELRFNFSSYKQKGNGVVINLESPFIHNQYDIVPVIELLIDYGETGVLDQDLLSSLPDYWQSVIGKNQKQNFDKEKRETENELQKEVLNQALKTLSIDEISELIRRMNNVLSFGQVMKILEKSRWNYLVTIEALRKLEEKLSFGQVMEISEKSHWDYLVTIEALKKLEGELSFDQMMEISEKSGWDYSVTAEALKKLEGELSFGQVMEISEKSGWKYLVTSEALKKLEGELSFGQVMEISEKSGWKYLVTAEALKKLEGELSFDQMMEISEKSGWKYLVTSEALKKLEGELSFGQVMEISKRSGWKYLVTAEALKKLEGELSFDQMMEISEKLGWELEVINEALKKLENNEDDGSFIYKSLLKKLSKERQLLAWSLLLKINFKTPVRLNNKFFS